MSKKVFIDTSGWIALLFPNDDLSARANGWMNVIKQQKSPMVTSTAVLIEVLDGLAQQNLRHLSSVLQSAISYSLLDVVDVNHDLFSVAWDLYKNRIDKNWGLTDCTSFIIMQQRDMMDALTYDIHFAQAGFRSLLREETYSTL